MWEACSRGESEREKRVKIEKKERAREKPREDDVNDKRKEIEENY